LTRAANVFLKDASWIESYAENILSFYHILYLNTQFKERWRNRGVKKNINNGKKVPAKKSLVSVV